MWFGGGGGIGAILRVMISIEGRPELVQYSSNRGAIIGAMSLTNHILYAIRFVCLNRDAGGPLFVQIVSCYLPSRRL